MKDLHFEDTSSLGGKHYAFFAFESVGGVRILCEKEGRSDRDYWLKPEKVAELRDWLTEWLEQEKR